MTGTQLTNTTYNHSVRVVCCWESKALTPEETIDSTSYSLHIAFISPWISDNMEAEQSE